MENEVNPIEEKIHEIRGQKAMLDFDLAELYQVETKVFNQSVKRNPRRFPPDFMFQINENEFSSLRSQIVTSKRGGTRYMPYAFTEQGVAMLSGILNSDIAIEVNIKIMRAFVAVRNQLANSISTSSEIERLKKTVAQMQEDMEALNQSQENTDEQMEDLFQAFARLSAQIQSKTVQLGRIKIEGFSKK